MELLTMKEAAEKLGKKVGAIYDSCYAGRIKRVTDADGKPKIPMSEIERILGKSSGQSNGKEWLTIREFAQAVDAYQSKIHLMVTNGRIKQVKKEKFGKIFKYVIHNSEIAPFKAQIKPVIRRGPNFLRNISEVPEPTVELKPITLSALKNLVLDKGKIPYKNMSIAVQMVIEHKDWNDITEETGMKKKAVTMLIEEMQMAEEEEPGKYKLVMDYLNAGRPWHPKNRDMRKNGKKFKKE